MAYLILVRHGQSAWNELGLWTGWSDVDLTDLGRAEARRTGERIKHLPIDTVHVSALRRTHQTAEELLRAHGTEVEVEVHPALNERHYGVHTGKNKWEVREAVGEDEFTRIRRSWDHPIPEGETLKDVHTRVVPHFTEHVEPCVQGGKTVAIVAHGNTLRALIKHIENIHEDAIAELEVATGEPRVYEHTDGVYVRVVLDDAA